MMTPQNEQLSALMDGELIDPPLNRVNSDESARHTWQRYHLISDVMHRRDILPANSDLTFKISELIKNEPAILAPAVRTAPALLKPAAGLAIAASVAALAILGVQYYQTDIQGPNQAEIALVQPQQPVRDMAVTMQPPLVQPVSSTNTAVVRPVQMQVQTNTKISRYIMQHNEYQSNVGMQGVMPHVRLVTIEANE